MEPKIEGTNRHIIPIIVGPTCSGKTALSLILSQIIPSEIISADSRQIYKHLNIGTAKPAIHELQKVQHHFIDMLEPDEDYNVSRFESDAFIVINSIFKRGKTPVVTGGSGLYVKALVDGIFDSVDTDEDFRAHLTEKKNKYGIEYLHEELQQVDPESALKMLPQNWKRIMRALEVFHLTGKPIGELQAAHKREASNNFVQVGLDWERSALYKNIETRVDEMMENGLVNEVKDLLEKGYAKTLNSLNTVGYKEIISYLDNVYSLEKAIELIKRNTRHYAKRQLTWFRADNRIKWFKISSRGELHELTYEIEKWIREQWRIGVV